MCITEWSASTVTLREVNISFAGVVSESWAGSEAQTAEANELEK